MGDQQEQVYKEGYDAYLSGIAEHSNPYTGLDAEFWSDGREDAQEDEAQRNNDSNKKYADSITDPYILKQHSLQREII